MVLEEWRKRILFIGVAQPGDIPLLSFGVVASDRTSFEAGS
jgi:hypothetical protein